MNEMDQKHFFTDIYFQQDKHLDRGFGKGMLF